MTSVRHLMAATLISAAAFQLQAAPPALTVEESDQWVKLRDLLWETTLSEGQIAFVTEALESSNEFVLEAALDNAMLHGLDQSLLAQNFSGQVRDTSLLAFASHLQDALRLQDDPYLQLRRLLSQELQGDEFMNIKEQLEHYRPTRKMISTLLVVREVKLVRTGATDQIDVEQLMLDEAETLMVDYSKMDTDEAVATIVKQLSQAQRAGKHEYALVTVLQTYLPAQYTGPVIGALKNHPTMNDYAKILLLRSLHFRTDRMSASQRQELVGLLDSMEQAGGVQSLQSFISVMKQEVDEAA